MPKGIRIRWTESEVKIVMDNYKVLHKAEILKMLQEINPARTYGSLKWYYNDHHLISGFDGRFEKGHSPKNKGKKLSPETIEKIKGTWFKKGNRPHNTHDVNTEIVWKREKHQEKGQYLYVKVAEPNVWRPKHH